MSLRERGGMAGTSLIFSMEARHWSSPTILYISRKQICLLINRYKKNSVADSLGSVSFRHPGSLTETEKDPGSKKKPIVFTH